MTSLMTKAQKGSALTGKQLDYTGKARTARQRLTQHQSPATQGHAWWRELRCFSHVLLPPDGPQTGVCFYYFYRDKKRTAGKQPAGRARPLLRTLSSRRGTPPSEAASGTLQQPRSVSEGETEKAPHCLTHVLTNYPGKQGAKERVSHRERSL